MSIEKPKSIAAAIWVGLCGVWLALCHLSLLLPIDNWLHVIFGMLPPVFLFLPCFFVLLILVLRFRSQWQAIGVFLGLNFLLGLPLLGFEIPNRPVGHSILPSSSKLKVMSFNVHYYSRRLTKALDLIKKEEIDVLLLQEIKGDDELMHTWLARELGGWHTFHEGETAIVSRWPLTNIRSVPLPVEDWRRIISADVEGPYKFRVLSIHWTIDPFFEGGDFLRVGADAQRQNLEAMLDEAAKTDLPLVIGGDFNNPPRHGLSRQLSQNMTNCFEAVGWGPGWTFPSSYPVLRIDHLLVNKGFTPLSCWVGSDVGSDHRPLIAELVFEPFNLSRSGQGRLGLPLPK
jgi:vancomycin resistance protein VanJ